MKQLIFTLALLPFLAAYPAVKPADAKSALSRTHCSSASTPALPDPADVKIAHADISSPSLLQTTEADAKTNWYEEIHLAVPYITRTEILFTEEHYKGRIIPRDIQDLFKRDDNLRIMSWLRKNPEHRNDYISPASYHGCQPLIRACAGIPKLYPTLQELIRLKAHPYDSMKRFLEYSGSEIVAQNSGSNASAYALIDVASHAPLRLYVMRDLIDLTLEHGAPLEVIHKFVTAKLSEWRDAVERAKKDPARAITYEITQGVTTEIPLLTEVLAYINMLGQERADAINKALDLALLPPLRKIVIGYYSELPESDQPSAAPQAPKNASVAVAAPAQAVVGPQ